MSKVDSFELAAAKRNELNAAMLDKWKKPELNGEKLSLVTSIIVKFREHVIRRIFPGPARDDREDNQL